MRKRILLTSLIFLSAFVVFAGCSSSSSKKSTDTTIPVTGVTLKSATSLLVGGTEPLTAGIVPANATNQNVTWSSDNTAVATVDAAGLVTAVTAGTANITVSTVDGNFKATCVVTTSYVPIPVTSISLNPSASQTLGLGGSYSLAAVFTPTNATNQNVTWTVAPSGVVSLSATTGSSITVTGSTVGSAIVKVTTADGNFSATSSVSVSNSVTSITVTGAAGASTITTDGGTLQLSAAVLPATATQTVTWSSDAPLTAKVEPTTGLVTAVFNGTANITAKATDGSGVVGTLAVTVSNQVPTVFFVKQSLADVISTSTATISSGSITVHNSNTSGGNAYKYIAPNFGYGSSCYLAFPTQFAGDFSVEATIVVNTQNNTNNASGIGIGMFTGYTSGDSYALDLMRNSSNAAVAYYVKNATSVGTGGTSVTYTAGNTIKLMMSRVGATVNMSMTNVTTGITTSQLSAAGIGNFYNVAGNVYAGISFANVDATITNFHIVDATSTTVYDSAIGRITPLIPASLTLSTTAVDMPLIGGSAQVQCDAVPLLGGVTTYSLSGYDSSIVSAVIAGNKINLTPVGPGTTTVTVTNDSDTNVATKTKTFTVTVNAYSTTDGYGSIPAASLYPNAGAAAAFTDGELAITFDSPPTLNTGGTVRIYKLSDGSLVDTIGFASESQTVNGVQVFVQTQLARLSGNTLYITPHFGKLAYGTAYYIVIPTTAITGTFNGKTFVGFSDKSTVATWNFTTKAAPSLVATNVTVDGAQNSTANFRTVGGALMYLAANPIAAATAVTVNVAAGTYNELVNYRAATYDPTLTITVAGPAGNNRGDNCVIQYVNGGNWNGQSARATFYFAGANLVLKNVYLRSTGTKAAMAQAETLYFDSRADYKCAVNNCSFSSWQDTIQTSGRCWFYNCYIEGNTDFIWGISDAALFESCALKVRNDGTATVQSIFVARTGTTGATTVGKGYVLLNSTVSVDTVTCTFGRDAGAGTFYDQVALVNNTFSGTGTVGSDTAGKNYLWTWSTAPTKLGVCDYVGWKAQGNTGLGVDTLTAVNTTYYSLTVNTMATEYDTRDHILNRVVTVASGSPTGFTASATTWDISALVTAFGAP
jgi:uncharacterized protein YjdB